MAKATHGYNRTVKRTVRLSQSEDIELVARSRRGNAKTPSAYLRYLALHGAEVEVPAWEYLRALTNAMVQNTNELRRLGLTKVLEAKAGAAYDAVSRIGTRRT